MGGSFTTVDGEARLALASVSADTAALQSYSVEPTQVDWLRSGSGPELNRASIEMSSDGTIWGPQVDGERTDGGWRFEDQSIDMDTQVITYLRFRGYYSAGLYDGAGSIVETIKQVYLSEQPDEDFCTPIKTTSGGLALICL